ncbi:Transmembrane protein 165-like 3, partial [Homarus americanus]
MKWCGVEDSVVQGCDSLVYAALTLLSLFSLTVARTMSHMVWMVTLATLALCAGWSDLNSLGEDPSLMRDREQALFKEEVDSGVGVHIATDDRSSNSSLDKENKTEVSDISFLNAFVAALSMIVVTELGDKTFFIAAIMAMNHPRITVFSGAVFALSAMHIISALFGYVITWIPRLYTFYASSALFAIFGLKMLYEAWKMKPNEGQEELEEVQSDIRRREDDHRREPAEEVSVAYTPNSQDGSEVIFQRETVEESGTGTRRVGRSTEEGGTGTRRVGRSAEEDGTGTRRVGRSTEEGGTGTRRVGRSTEEGETETRQGDGSTEDTEVETLRGGSIERLFAVHSRVFLQSFTMTFLAEWGDRSQIGTVVMAARENVYGVIVGGLLGHILCTGLAVVGGRLIAAKISVRT